MGMDRYDTLVIGFVAEAEDVLKPFEVEVDEKSHLEDRFDSKTGKKLAPAKVIDVEAGTEYEVDGKSFDDREEVFDYLCKRTGAVWNMLVDDGETCLISIEPKALIAKKENLKLEAKFMARVCEDASQIRTLFKKNWGILLDEAAIQTVETYG
jgi:hypothetical protein